MKYMLLIYNRPDFTTELSDEERTAMFADVGELMRELTESGELVGGQALVHPSQAKTVRGRDGQPVVSDGPFLESKEQFGGYCTIDVETEERAIEIARRWPDPRYGGAIELRAIMDEGVPEE